MIPRVTKMKITCQVTPWQAEGELDDGRVFYFRHRFCTASLGAGATMDEAVDASFLNEITYHRDNDPECPGRGYCSGLAGEEIAYVFQKLAASLPVSPAAIPPASPTTRPR